MTATQCNAPAEIHSGESPSQGRGSYWITTFGCQMNKADSERMAGILEAMGYREAEAELEADLVLYNTCTIRDNAEQKVYSYLGRQAQRKRANPNLTLVVAGCVAQQEGESLLRRVPELDLVMGPQHANRLDVLLAQVEQGQQVVATEEHHILEDITTARRDSTICGWVNVIYGCNERCTYCVVPSVRGREQSRLPEAIRLEMEGLAARGFREITLLGQNIDAYGRDLPGITPEGRRAHTLTDLLFHVHEVEGLERLRFATSHPRYFTDRLIDACADLPKVCEHFHIPFQSGDNEILRAMARGYTVERYRRMGNMIVGEMTLYDPEVLLHPVTAKLRFELDPETRPELRPLYNTCTDTNGPSAKVFMDSRGKLNERLPGDPLYWDAADPRPWGSFLDESDKRYEQFRRRQ